MRELKCARGTLDPQARWRLGIGPLLTAVLRIANALGNEKRATRRSGVRARHIPGGWSRTRKLPQRLAAPPSTVGGHLSV